MVLVSKITLSSRRSFDPLPLMSFAHTEYGTVDTLFTTRECFRSHMFVCLSLMLLLLKAQKVYFWHAATSAENCGRLRIVDTPPSGQLAYCMVISPTRQFAYWTFRLFGQFAYYLDLSPTSK